MEEGLNDPVDVPKQPELIKAAQADIARQDVLVCGGCHEVFYFIEQFQQHKNDDVCLKISTLKKQCENEVKPQVWGFTLWKNKQVQGDDEKSTPWTIYQRWCKLEQTEKDLWIAAGQNLQEFDRTSTAKLQEFKVKEDEKKFDGSDENVVPNNAETITVALDETVKRLVKDGTLRVMRHVSTNTMTGVRSVQDDKEFIVEKISGKRYNPKRRTWEYQVKWENYDEPTWEPIIHLENCKKLVEEFDEKLRIQKEKDKPQPTPTGRGRGRPRLTPGAPKPTPRKSSPPPLSNITLSPTGGRPTRTSKQKALNQVKAWCGNISDSDEVTAKRPYEDDDDDSYDSFDKKMKYADDSDDTDYEEPTSTPNVKRQQQIPKVINTYNNGALKKLPSNVLIPDAKGVVRISQKQLPALSSGVYIMSKSSGIIKLDPAASKLATSGGQTILKVSPKVGQKVGQAQIKLIRKSETTTTTATTITDVNELKAATKLFKPVIKQIKRPDDEVEKKLNVSVPVTSQAAPKILNEIVSSKFPSLHPNVDDSDDGIEELEFPTDAPLPDPDSPPGEFTLDPETGKIAGIEYPENEPQSQESKQAQMDNIVKLAAADITEDDLKSDGETATEAVPVVAAAVPSATVETPAVVDPKNEATLLNTVMGNTNILQKTLLNPNVGVTRPKPHQQPRILNQTMTSRNSVNVTPVIRSVNTNPDYRKKQQYPHPRITITSMKVNIGNQKNVYAKSPMTQKMEYKTTKSTPKSSVQRSRESGSHVHKTQIAQQAPPPPPKPKPVISMPSLSMDEELPTVVAAQQQQQQQPQIAAALIEAKHDVIDQSAEVVGSELATTFSLADGETPMFITGDDGTVYQVAGQNEEGQTILVTQDSNGQQQCLLVTNETVADETQLVDENAAAVAQAGGGAAAVMAAGNGTGMEVVEDQQQIEGASADEQPVVAQFVRTEPPSPGGTHKVVVMLPDGNMMLTQVTPEEYASLAVDK